MARPKVLIGRDYSLNQIFDAVARRLGAQGCEVLRPAATTGWQVQDSADLLPEIDVLMISSRTPVSAAQLDSAGRLRGFVFASIGTEAIDLAETNPRGLMVAHGPTPEGYIGIAEATVMLIAALLLDLPGKEKATRLNLPRPGPLDMRAQLVMGKTVGLIGLGRIARGVVDRLKGWQARIIAYDPHLPADAFPPEVRRVDYATLLAESDVISVHVSLTDETRHMLGAAEFAQMKPGVFLINTARGGAIDEVALIEALKSGRVAGAALDVFNREPFQPDDPLRDLDNVILTSHMVGQTRQANESLVPVAVENTMRIIRGETPIYVRNPEVMEAWRRRLAGLPVYD